MPTAEVCFPRGGKIKRKLANDKSEEKETDRLFGRPSKKAKKGKKSKEKRTRTTEENRTDEIRHLNALRQEDLEVHMVLLGRVRRVDELQLLVSLPCHLVGAVPATNVSEALSGRLQQHPQEVASLRELFAEGQYVSCCVLSADVSGHKARNTLSTRPSDVNAALPASALRAGMVLQCAVRSEEDNVYAIECGIPGTRAVLPKSGLGSDPDALVAGQVLWCMVDAVRVDDGVHTLTLTADPARLNGAALTADAGVSSQTLLPGMRLPITVSKVLSGGLSVTLPGELPAFVYKTHLDEAADCADDYNVGAAAHARVLYTLPLQRRTFVTLRPAVLRLPAGRLAAELLQDDEPERRRPATVLDADAQGVRLLLQTGQVAFAPTWHATRTGSEKARWRRGEEARCVLLGYDAMDDLYIASMKKDQEVPQSAAALVLGQKVSCRVRLLTEHGCRVELDGGAVGFIPLCHLTNIPVSLAQQQTMFPEGKRLKCRVIWTDPERRKLELTHNARLVSTGLSLVSEPSQLKRGHTGHWIVRMVSASGLRLNGFSGLIGAVPSRLLTAELKDCFVGQIIECTVCSVRGDGLGRRVTLSPVGSGAGAAWRGKLTSARVTGRSGDKLLVLLGESQQAELPAAHLTDIPEHADAALNRYKTGDELEVVGLHSYGNSVIVSAKPLLLEYVKKKAYPELDAEVVPGQRLPAYIVGSHENGVSIAFPTGCLSATYRVSRSSLGDGWHLNMKELRSLKHRTLMVELLPNRPGSDAALRRFSARSKPARDKGGVPYLKRCLRELSTLVPGTPRPGDTVKGKVVRSTPESVILQLEKGGGQGVISDPPEQIQDAGSGNVTATVVHVAPSGHLSLVVGEEMQSTPEKGSVRRRQAYAARVLRSGGDGYVRTALLLPPGPPCLVLLPVRRGINDLTGGGPHPLVGAPLQLRIVGVENGVLLGEDAEAAHPRKSARSTDAAGKPQRKSRQRKQSPGKPKKPKSARHVGYSRFVVNQGD